MGIPLQRNSEKCIHCGLVFGSREEIPLINRSDGKTFHLRLISKPVLRPIFPSGLPSRHVICNFAYAHTRIETENRFVILLTLGPERRGFAFNEVEYAADKLAEVLKIGAKLKAAYLVKVGKPLIESHSRELADAC